VAVAVALTAPPDGVVSLTGGPCYSWSHGQWVSLDMLSVPLRVGAFRVSLPPCAMLFRYGWLDGFRRRDDQVHAFFSGSPQRAGLD
jgi:hypothetical protein